MRFGSRRSTCCGFGIRVNHGRKEVANRNDVHVVKGNCPVTIGEDAILRARRRTRRRPSIRPARRTADHDDVATLTRLAGEGSCPTTPPSISPSGMLQRLSRCCTASVSASKQDWPRSRMPSDLSRFAFRILIEIEEQDLGKADAIADGIAQVLERANILRPVLLHGLDATVWHFVNRAHQWRWSTRVGLEMGANLRMVK